MCRCVCGSGDYGGGNRRGGGMVADVSLYVREREGERERDRKGESENVRVCVFYSLYVSHDFGIFWKVSVSYVQVCPCLSLCVCLSLRLCWCLCLNM